MSSRIFKLAKHPTGLVRIIFSSGRSMEVYGRFYFPDDDGILFAEAVKKAKRLKIKCE